MGHPFPRERRVRAFLVIASEGYPRTSARTKYSPMRPYDEASEVYKSRAGQRELTWMKTRFQISITSGSSMFTRLAASRPPILSKWSSEQGPHGPTSPICVCATGRYDVKRMYGARKASTTLVYFLDILRITKRWPCYAPVMEECEIFRLVTMAPVPSQPRPPLIILVLPPRSCFSILSLQLAAKKQQNSQQTRASALRITRQSVAQKRQEPPITPLKPRNFAITTVARHEAHSPPLSQQLPPRSCPCGRLAALSPPAIL